MQYTRLGRTALKVSRLCLGTMNFGTTTSEADAFRIMDRALDRGINFFDTADVYGWQLGEGVTEQIIGRWLAQGGGRRDKVVLGTKVYGPMGNGPNQSGLSALHIRQACMASLKRLGVDHIDLYQMHYIDRNAPWDEVWQAMDLLVQQGKVIYVGSSNFAGWHIAQANEAAKARPFLGLCSEQSLYNLLDRTLELEVIPACQAYGLGLIAWSPLKSGVLAGLDLAAEKGRRMGPLAQQTISQHGERLERWDAFCKTLGDRPANVALAWVLANRAVSCALLGPRTVEQLDGSLRALAIQLDDTAMKELDDLFPGPGGAAPDAYAHAARKRLTPAAI